MPREWTVTVMSKADARAMMAVEVFESAMGRVKAVRQLGPRQVLVKRCGRLRWWWGQVVRPWWKEMGGR